MPFDSFMKIDGIPGESTDSKHKDWIEIMSFTWGVSQKYGGSRSSAGAATAERVEHQDFSIVKAIDKATPKLFLACCKGDHIKEIKIALCRATGDKQQYMLFTMTDSFVSSIQPGGAAQDQQNLPLEEVKFGYGKIELTYTETDHQTGKPKGDVKSFWSLVENKGG